MTNNLCVTTVFLSAGDSGTTGDTYVHSRESGNEAATAQMAGVADSYTEISAIFGGQPVIVRTLVGAPSVQKVWFRLPDGNMDGSGEFLLVERVVSSELISIRMVRQDSLRPATNPSASSTLAPFRPSPTSPRPLHTPSRL